MLHHRSYKLSELEPYINWAYFYHAWSLKPQTPEAVELQHDALSLLQTLNTQGQALARVLITPCHTDTNDIILDLPSSLSPVVLHLQRQTTGEPPYKCLADFLNPHGDTIGIFCTTVPEIGNLYPDDDYLHLLAQTLADRLAEAAAERLHEEVRKTLWGYAPHEHLTPAEMHAEKFQGIRPAVGYPSLPDITINRTILPLLHYQELGMALTSSAMMIPHASVSGLMIAHPLAHYFSINDSSEPVIPTKRNEWSESL